MVSTFFNSYNRDSQTIDHGLVIMVGESLILNPLVKIFLMCSSSDMTCYLVAFVGSIFVYGNKDTKINSQTTKTTLQGA